MMPLLDTVQPEQPEPPPGYYDCDALTESIMWQLAKDGGMPEPTPCTYAAARDIAERFRDE